MNDELLLSFFSTFGDITDIQLPRETENGMLSSLTSVSKHRGYAFITYANEEDAEDAIDNMHLNEWYGVRIVGSP